jgi:hypothetical protein
MAAPDPLATLADLRTRLEVSTSDTSSDSYFTSLLNRATAKVEQIVGRRLTEKAWTEYVDGDGTRFLNLRQGPATSSTATVADVSYSSSGTASTASIASGQWFLRGQHADGWKLPCYVEAVDWRWTAGQQNYQVSYTTGWSTSSTSSSAPYDIQEAVLYAAVWMKNKRKDAATSSRDVGGGHLGGFKNETQLDDELRSMLAAYSPVG